MPPVIDEKLCNCCGICYDICPQDVFSFNKKSEQTPAVTYPRECWYCGACVVDCPRGAVTLTLPLPLHIVPSPALYGPPGPEEEEALRSAANFSRSIEWDTSGVDETADRSAGAGKTTAKGPVDPLEGKTGGS
jgi:adenylylsulfate reductase subunit B